MAMSDRATLTNPLINIAAEGTIANFIGHMKSIIEKSKNNNEGLVFANLAILSKHTNNKLIALNFVNTKCSFNNNHKLLWIAVYCQSVLELF